MKCCLVDFNASLQIVLIEKFLPAGILLKLATGTSGAKNHVLSWLQAIQLPPEISESLLL